MALAVMALAALGAGHLEAAQGMEVVSVTPSFSPFNVAGRTVTVKGVGFSPSTTVTFGATAAAVTFVDSRTLVATVPTLGAAALSTITVTDPGNGADQYYPYFHTGPVIYVAKTGVDNNQGTTPGAPKLTLAAAFAAASGTTPTEIRVGPGVWVESQLALPDRTVLSCGWATGFGSRDPDLNVTEVNANRNGWVIRTLGLQSVSAVDGCTLTHGLRDGFGGGALVISADTMVVNNNVIVGNMSTTMGGAAYFSASTVYGGQPSFTNNVMLGNRAHNKNGGGIVVYPNYNTQQPIRVNVAGNFIMGNRSIGGRGGGFAMSTSSYSGYNSGVVKVADNVVSGNSSKTGGGIDISLLTAGDYFDVSIFNNLVTGNTAQGTGGGVSFQGFGAIDGAMSSSTIADNAAAPGLGGGLLMSGATNFVSGFEATDLILWGNAGGDAAGQALTLVDYSDSGTALSGVGNISSDPMFTPGVLGSYYLAQLDPNSPTSPAVDAGSQTAMGLSLDDLTTRVDEVPDTGIADLGFHFPASVGDSPDPISIARLDPPEGDILGRDWVLIRGGGFDPGATVSFGGVPAAKLLYVGHGRILAKPAAHAPGQVTVVVENPDLTSAQIANGYRYIDNTAPVWSTTVGVVGATSNVDTCQRSVILSWNGAVDVSTGPVFYEVYREECIVGTSTSVPCDNFGFVPNATSFRGFTGETTWVDQGFAAGGQDKKYIYNVRARDSATPLNNKEWNFAKRIVTATKAAAGQDVAPAAIGNNLRFASGSTTLVDWPTSAGATSYGLYRQSTAAPYGSPGTLTKFMTLTAVNNDGNGDGVADSQFNDTAVPAAGGIFFYKVTAIDPCGNETTSEL